MPRTTPFESMVRALRIKLAKPPAAAQLKSAEGRLEYSLPAALTAFYEECNGGKAGNDLSDLQLHSLRQALAYQNVLGLLDGRWQLWPLATNNDSNLVCVCCRPPLTGYVVLVPHDEDRQLMYRSISAFFAAATAFVADGTFLDTSALPTDFGSAQRTKGDAQAATKLMKLARQDSGLSEQDRIDAAGFACDLLSDDEADQIASLLDVEDQAVRDHVERRLKQIPGTKVRTTVNKLAGTFAHFVESCGTLLRQHGIAATVLEMYGKKTIRLDPGPVWLNMQSFYDQRKRPDFEAFLLDRVRAVAKPQSQGRRNK